MQYCTTGPGRRDLSSRDRSGASPSLSVIPYTNSASKKDSAERWPAPALYMVTICGVSLNWCMVERVRYSQMQMKTCVVTKTPVLSFSTDLLVVVCYV